MIDRKLLIELFEQRDRKRRAQLFEMFESDILCGLTRKRIADIISAKLGRPGLISADDVRYCRFYFKDSKAGKRTSQKQTPPSSNQKPAANGTKPSSAAGEWSDGDEVKLQDQFSFKSKYAKKP